MILGFHPRDPGSTPGRGTFFFSTNNQFIFKKIYRVGRKPGGQILKTGFKKQVKIHPPGIEPGTYRVLGGRHNQLDHGC